MQTNAYYNRNIVQLYCSSIVKKCSRRCLRCKIIVIFNSIMTWFLTGTNRVTGPTGRRLNSDSTSDKIKFSIDLLQFGSIYRTKQSIKSNVFQVMPINLSAVLFAWYRTMSMSNYSAIYIGPNVIARRWKSGHRIHNFVCILELDL